MKTIDASHPISRKNEESQDNLKSKNVQNYSSSRIRPAITGFPHIFITGKAGHGKDSIGDHLIANFAFEKLSFSDGIREEITRAYSGPLSSVTNEWQNVRQIKEIPQARLSLVYCTDKEFVLIAMNEFKKEDRELFARLRSDGNTISSPSSLSSPSSPSSLFPGAKDNFSESTRMMLPRSPRRIQQLWGTEYRRSQNVDYWLDFAKENADFSRSQVLTSVRYASELDFGVQIGAVRIHVERPGASIAHEHITEQMLPLDAKTIVILNTGSLADLCLKVDSTMVNLMIESEENKNENVRISKVRP